MRTRSGVAVLTAIGIVLIGIILRTKPAVGQAPNQAQMVTQTVAGVKFSTLPGFAIERINPPEKNDTFVVITFDSLGRLAVSKENDHPRFLLDNDKDGIYESEKVITDKVRNCQGLWFDGRTLYGSCVLVAEAPAAAPAAGGGGQAPVPVPPLGDGPQKVTCYTCHRGQLKPATSPGGGN